MSDSKPQYDPETQHEEIVADFFAQMDEPEADEPEEAAEAAESDEEGEEAPAPSEAPEAAQEAAETPEEPSEEDDDVDEGSDEPEINDYWDKRFRDQQSWHDKQMNELRQELQAARDWMQMAYQQQVEQYNAAQQQANNPAAHLDHAQIAQHVETDLVGTFRTVAAHRPDLVPATIAAARDKYGNQVGDQMQFEYNNYVLEQRDLQARQQAEAAERARMEAEAPAMIRETMNDIVNGIAEYYGEAFTAVQDQFVQRAQETMPAFKEYMDSNGHEITPGAVHQFLVSTFNDVRESNFSKQASQPRKPQPMKPTDHVEGSTAGENPDDVTPDQSVINEILMGAKELNIDMNVPTS